MKPNALTSLAQELSAEGDHFSASVIHFLSALRAANDEAGLAVLACFAQKLCQQRFDRAAEENEAIVEMMEQL